MPISDPLVLLACLVVLIAFIFGVSRIQRLARLFEFAPPVIWCYFVPMLLSTAGVFPTASPVYDAASQVGLLVSLFLLTVTVDVRAILQVGPRALAMLVAGSVGIVIGGPLVYLLFRGALPDDAWMGLAALSGSWIGGTANMVAVKEGIGAPDSVIAPIIVVDTVFAYGWMGILLFLSTQQARIDSWLRADRTALDDFTARRAGSLDVVPSLPPDSAIPAPDPAEAEEAVHTADPRVRSTSTADLALVIGLGLGAAALARWASGFLPPIGDPVVIISRNTWAILLTVTVGLALSFTRLRRLDDAGASAVGYYVLYVILATIGAQADVRAVASFPAYMLAGAVWMLVHMTVLFGTARLLRAPLALVATGSMATVGGPASTPVVAGTYHPALAPVGLLLAVASNVLGIYLSFFCAFVLEWLSR